MTREDSTVSETRTVQAGNYRFTGKTLGKGTFATVEEAIHIHLKVKVSVKTINLVKCNAYVLKHIKREAAILNQLYHPHVVRLFEAFKYGNVYCLVTEVVTGGDLCAHLRQQRGRNLDERTTRRFVRQIASALQYLHSNGVVHRDLKLENIMLDSRKENVKLVDFGLSNHWSLQSPLQTLCGSPEYSAPELFVYGTKYGPEVDMWALGVVIYAMAVGQLPFPCVSAIMKIQEKKDVFIKLINNGLTKKHIDRVVGYSKEFVGLLRSLMNPMCYERISAEDVFKDPWVSNRNHWLSEQHETLDAHDFAKVARQVCGQLEITEDMLRDELKTKPCGEIAGFYNIALFQMSHPKQTETLRFSTRVSTSNSRMSFHPNNNVPPKYMYKPATSNKVWVVGTASKINEVIKGKRSLLNNISKFSISPSSQDSHTNWFCKKSRTPDTKAGGDFILPKIPQIGPFKATAKTTESSLSDTPKSRDSEKTIQSHVKFKEKNAVLHHQILPSKLKLKSSFCKVERIQQLRPS